MTIPDVDKIFNCLKTQGFKALSNRVLVWDNNSSVHISIEEIRYIVLCSLRKDWNLIRGDILFSCITKRYFYDFMIKCKSTDDEKVRNTRSLKLIEKFENCTQV